MAFKQPPHPPGVPDIKRRRSEAIEVAFQLSANSRVEAGVRRTAHACRVDANHVEACTAKNLTASEPISPGADATRVASSCSLVPSSSPALRVQTGFSSYTRELNVPRPECRR